jgi:hypothetical protein
MPPPTPLWKYFEKLPGKEPHTLYRNDHSHKKAWCNECLTAEVTNLRRGLADVTVAGGTPGRPPSEDTLRRQGMCLSMSRLMHLSCRL